MKIAVVILNWNGEALLNQFLPSVTENCAKDVDIYVADNASSDNSIQFVADNYKNVIVQSLDKNYGYAGGYNRSLKKIDADIFVLLNSDVEVTPNWLDPIVKRFQSDKNIAAIQPKIKAFKDKDSFEYAGAAGGFIDRWGYTFCRGRLFDHLEKDLGQYDESTEIFWASGACLCVRREAFEEVGGLDGDFFAHMEEIDLCWRIKNRGYSIWYEADAEVYHVGGATLDQARWQKTYLNFRNNLFLMTKNDYSKFFFIKLVYRMILDGVSFFKFLLDGYPKHSFAVLKAHFSFYVALIPMLGKRKALKKVRTSINTNGIFKKSVVWAYFIQKKKTFQVFTKS